MCRIMGFVSQCSFLQFQNIFVKYLILINGAVFKYAVTDLVICDAQYPQPGRKMGIPPKIWDIQVHVDLIDIILHKSLVHKGHAQGADIHDRHFFTQKSDKNAVLIRKYIPESFPLVLAVPDIQCGNRIRSWFGFFPEQIQPSCFPPCRHLWCWAPGA
jgi:hypothetical protein